MYNYGDLELKVLCCFWINPSLLDTTKLEVKHFIHSSKIFILFNSFYKKFGNLNVETMCNLVNDKYKFMQYINVIINQEVTASNFESLEKAMIDLYEESKTEKWLREKIFELANDLYVKNITTEQFKEKFDKLYKNAKEICKND